MSNKKQKKESAFPENQVMMMLESMQGGIEIISEGQQGLRDDFNEFKTETRKNFTEIRTDLSDFKIETRENFKKVNQKLDKHEKHLKQHDKRFEQVDKNFEKVFTSLAEIKQEIQDIKKELDQMKNQPVIKREEFELLVKRVERVEMSIEH